MAKIKYKICEDGSVKDICELVVLRLRVSDIEDPVSFALNEIHKWAQSEPGKFIFEHAKNNIRCNQTFCAETSGHNYILVAEIPGEFATEYALRWK